MSRERIGEVVRGTVGWTDRHGVHWQAYAARCAECHRTLYPTLTASPDPDWRCGVCEAGPGARGRSARTPERRTAARAAGMTPQRLAALAEGRRRALEGRQRVARKLTTASSP